MSPIAVMSSSAKPQLNSNDPNLSEVEKSDVTISLIDLKELQGPHRSQTVEQIGRACKHYGFFLVKNHGIPETLTKKVLGILKESLKSPESSNPTSSSNAFADYHRKIRWLEQALFEAISESLGFERDYIEKQLNNHAMTFNYHPPRPQPETVFGVPAHTDPTALNILLQDDVPGLQFLINGKWVPVNRIPSTFIVNIGDLMQVLSNDQYKSVSYRVIVNSNQERLSVVTFDYPSPEGRSIGPAKELNKNKWNKKGPTKRKLSVFKFSAA